MSVKSVVPCNHLILCRPLLLLPSIFPSIRFSSNESARHIRRPKYWSLAELAKTQTECWGQPGSSRSPTRGLLRVAQGPSDLSPVSDLSTSLGKLRGGDQVPPLEAKGEGRVGKVPGRAGNRRAGCLMGGNLSGLDFPRKPRTDRQTDTQITERPGSPPREAKTLTSDGLMNRQTETHSRKLQTRQTGQLEQLGAESDSGRQSGHTWGPPNRPCAEWGGGAEAAGGRVHRPWGT